MLVFRLVMDGIIWRPTLVPVRRQIYAETDLAPNPDLTHALVYSLIRSLLN